MGVGVGVALDELDEVGVGSVAGRGYSIGVARTAVAMMARMVSVNFILKWV